MKVAPKYRVLTKEELQELEKEFVEFLIVNGITADKWVSIKEEDKEAAEDMIVLFSDVVLEGVLHKVQFLEFSSSQDIKTFQCLKEKIVLVGMNSSDPNINFEDKRFLSEALTRTPKGVQVYTTDKSYSKDRQSEIFDMISNGASIADGKLFKTLSMALVK